MTLMAPQPPAARHLLPTRCHAMSLLRPQCYQASFPRWSPTWHKTSFPGDVCPWPPPGSHPYRLAQESRWPGRGSVCPAGSGDE